MAGPWEKYANPSTRYGADPVKVREQQLKEEANNRANEAAARAAAAAERANANSASANENTRIQTEIALATKGLTLAPDGSIVARPGGPVGGKPPADPARIAKLNSLIDQINRTQQLYEAGPGATDGLKGLADYLPTDANVMFDTSGAQLSEKGLAAFRIPGSGTMTDRDAAMFERANMPTASTRDAGIEEQLRGIRSRVDAELEQLGLPAAKWEGVPQQLATGQTRREVDPVASGIIDRMIRQGKSADEINAVLGPLGFNPVSPGDVAASQDYLRKNPKYDKSLGRAERILPIENPTLNAALQTAPGTAAATYLNAGGFGVPQALNPQAFEALRDKNPMSAFAGDVGGIITGTGLISKAGQQTIGRVLPAAVTNNPTTLQKFANFGRQLAPDAAYGAAYGGITEGDPLTGAATAAAGSGAGQLLGKGIQKGFQGVSDPAVQYLTDRGIPLSLGETLGNNSIVGRQMQRMESIPILGDLMSARRGEARDAVYRGVLEDAVQPIGGRIDPADPLASAQQAISGAYDNAVGNVTVPFDARYFDELGNARNAASTLPPDLKGKFDAAMASRVDPISGQEIYYHGSPKTIEGPLMPGDGGRLGPGIYFTPDQKAAMGYAGEKGAEGVHQRIIRGQLAPDTEFNSLYSAVPLGERPSPYSDEGKAYVNNVLQTLRDRGFVGIKGDDAYGNPSVNVIDPSALDLAAMSGQQYQQAMRGLSGYKSEATKPGFEQDYRDAISMVQDALKGQMMRGGGDTVVTGLRNADQAYSMLKPIQNATISARGTPTPKQLQAAFTTNTKKFGGDAAAARGDKVPDIVRYAVNNAPNIGNSGTADRLAGIMPFIMPTALGGSAVGLETFTDSPFLTGSLATLAALSTRTGQKAMQTALVKRPAAVRRAGGIFGRRETQKGLAGMVTAPLLIEQ